MWTCPKCGREFKRTNQGHYCGKAPETVEEYIESQLPEVQGFLMELRKLIRSSVPDATEKIAWSMPVYKNGKCSISFAACKNHVSFYLDQNVLEQFKPQLSGFTIKKNALYLPYNKELPVKTAEHIIQESLGVKKRIS